MITIRKSLAAMLFCAAVFLVGAQLAYALKTLTPAQEADARKCDNKMVACWNFCAGTKDSSTRERCDSNCVDKWKRCLRDSGVPWIERRMPKKPMTSAPGQNAGVERSPAPTPKRRPGETAPKAGAATKSSTASPTPAAKASP